MAGQSNAESMCSSNTGYRLNECTVYSTYAPTASRSDSINGISFSDYCTGNNSADFVVGSLNGTESISGKQLGISGICPDFRRKWEDRAGQRADI